MTLLESSPTYLPYANVYLLRSAKREDDILGGYIFALKLREVLCPTFIKDEGDGNWNDLGQVLFSLIDEITPFVQILHLHFHALYSGSTLVVLGNLWRSWKVPSTNHISFFFNFDSHYSYLILKRWSISGLPAFCISNGYPAALAFFGNSSIG